MNRVIVLLTVVTIALVGALPSQSQVLEEIVVTASKRQESLQDVGIAVTAFTGDQIRQLGFTDSIEIIQQTAGMTFGTPTAEGNNANLSLRGVALNDFSDNNESPVAVYVDEVYISAISGATFQMFDIERVEVLRGPQGTLFGRNSSGGLAHFITRKPTTEQNEGYVDLTVGENSQIQTELVFNAPLSDTSALRVSLAQNSFDGYVKNRYSGRDDPNDADNIAGRVQLLLQPSDDLELLFNVHYANEDSLDGSWQHQASRPDGPLGDVSVALEPNVDFFGTCPGCDGFGYRDDDGDPWAGDYDRDGPLELESSGASARVIWDISDSLELTSITSVENFDRFFGEDTELGPFAGIDPTFDAENDQFTQEIRLAGERDNLRWVGGLYYLSREVVGTTHVGVVTLNASGTEEACRTGACRPPDSNFLIFYDGSYKQETTSASIFGQFEYDFADNLTVIAGVRFTSEDAKMEMFAEDLAGTGFANGGLDPGFVFADFTAGAVGDLVNNDTENVTGKLALNWTPNDDLLLYGSLSQGIKSAGYNTGILDFQGVFNGLTPQQVPFDEETITSVEIGAKKTLWDGMGRMNFSLFNYQYDDFQALAFENLGQVLFNTDAKVSGGEIEFQASPTDGLDVILGVGYLFEATADNIPSSAGVIRDRDMVLAPDLQVNGLVRYSWPVGEGNMAVQVDGFYQTETFFDIQNHAISSQDAYSVWNAKVIYSAPNDRWSLTGWINNVFEEEYLVYTFDFSGAFGFNQLGYGRPRWAGATFTYNWGN